MTVRIEADRGIYGVQFELNASTELLVSRTAFSASVSTLYLFHNTKQGLLSSSPGHVRFFQIMTKQFHEKIHCFKVNNICLHYSF